MRATRLPYHAHPSFLPTRRVARYISRIRLPKVLVSAAIALLRIAIQRRGNFDLRDVAPIKAVGSTFVPALFAHADGDDFIVPQHSKALQAAYAGDSNFISFQGDHNSQVTEATPPTAPAIDFAVPDAFSRLRSDRSSSTHQSEYSFTLHYPLTISLPLHHAPPPPPALILLPLRV